MFNMIHVVAFTLMDKRDQADILRQCSAEAFQIGRALPVPAEPIAAADWLVNLGCLAVLGDRSAAFSRMLDDHGIPDLPLDSADWDKRFSATFHDMWLRLLRKRGWDDFDQALQDLASARKEQGRYEPSFLDATKKSRKGTGPVWHLVAQYNATRAAEILTAYLSQGCVDGEYNILSQLEAQCDHAAFAATYGGRVELTSLLHTLSRTARAMVSNSIWAIARPANSKAFQFVKSLADRNRNRPIFELLPAQRQALIEDGANSLGARSVALSLPPASGKTLIAEFRILQALDQFKGNNGWVAYLAPTRARVHQMASRLRRDFAPLGLAVESAMPALETDGLEAGSLQDYDPGRQFRILVTTPEKLQALLAHGWNKKIGRQLSLVVVEEASGFSNPQRGLGLELLLATINRKCLHAQFLLLTHFISNGEDIARWLAPESSNGLPLGSKWDPSDRVIAVARPQQGKSRGEFSIALKACQADRIAQATPETVAVGKPRPLGLAWSQVKRDASLVAAATAQVLQERGTVIVLADSIPGTWKIAQALKTKENRRTSSNGVLRDIQCFLGQEMGQDFPLTELLDYGVGVHHEGMSADARALVEWLAASGHLRVLASTSTLAEGLDFPVTGIVLAASPSHAGAKPSRQFMPAADFWKIACRTGRIGQADLGVIALAAKDDRQQAELEQFVAASAKAMHAPYVSLLSHYAGTEQQLDTLANEPGWSGLVQHLAHVCLQIGDARKLEHEAELLVRETFGYWTLRQKNELLAKKLKDAVVAYALKMKGKSPQLVDAAGLPWESASKTLRRMQKEHITPDDWTPDLFNGRMDSLRQIMGLMLIVPELRKPLLEAANGKKNDTGLLASIVSDWVHGRPLTEMAPEYFAHGKAPGSLAGEADPDPAMTMCCRQMFGQFTQAVSRGLTALQALTPGMDFEAMSPAEQRSLKNLPARAYYGVNSDEAVALSLLGVPRTASAQLAQELELLPEDPLSKVRSKLQGTGASAWEKAMGENGSCYRSVWSIIGGEVSEEAEVAA